MIPKPESRDPYEVQYDLGRQKKVRKKMDAGYGNNLFQKKYDRTRKEEAEVLLKPKHRRRLSDRKKRRRNSTGFSAFAWNGELFSISQCKHTLTISGLSLGLTIHDSVCVCVCMQVGCLQDHLALLSSLIRKEWLLARLT